MEELLAALKHYFDLIDNDKMDMDDWDYLDSIEKAEQDLRSFLHEEEYELPAFLTKGVTK